MQILNTIFILILRVFYNALPVKSVTIAYLVYAETALPNDDTCE